MDESVRRLVERAWEGERRTQVVLAVCSAIATYEIARLRRLPRSLAEAMALAVLQWELWRGVDDAEVGAP